jgi:uncharacterized membrane protein
MVGWMGLAQAGPFPLSGGSNPVQLTASEITTLLMVIVILSKEAHHGRIII